MTKGTMITNEHVPVMSPAALSVSELPESDDQVPVQPGYITRQQLTIMGISSGNITEYRKALDFMTLTADCYDFGAIVPNRYGLDGATEALTRMRAQEDIKPIIVLHEN